MISVLAPRTPQVDQRGGEFQLRIGSAKLDGLLPPGIPVETASWVGFAIAHPLLVRFRQIANVKPSKSSHVSGIRVVRAGLQSRDQFLRYLRILSRVDCRAIA